MRSFNSSSRGLDSLLRGSSMKTKNKLKVLYLSLAAFFGLVLLSISYFRVFDEFEYSTLDFRYLIRPDQPVSDDIVIVEIGDDSIEKLGKWPFPREDHAFIIRALNSAGARTIIFDIFFSEEKEGDDDFAAAVKEAGNVYMPYIFELDRTRASRDRVKADGFAAPLIDVLEDAAKGTGFINVEPDPDGKVRHIPPVIFYEGKFYPHMTVLAALNELGYGFDEAKIYPGKRIEAGNVIIPLDGSSSMLVNYPAKWGRTFRHYSYVDILQSYLAGLTGQEATLDLSRLKGAVCFIGLTATASPDAHPSPMEPLYAGVGVHTSVYNSIIRGSYLVRLNRWWNMVILALLGLLTASVTARTKKRFALPSILLIMAVYFVVAAASFWLLGIWIDVFYPIVAAGVIYVVLTFRKYVAETQKREVIEKELNIARDIQLSFLPKEIPSVGGLDIAAKMITARQVGGDLYDIFQIDEKRLGVMIGDVSGKGVPAALFMARVVSVFKTFARHGSPAKVLKDINDRLVDEGGSNLFVTLTYLVFDVEKKEMKFASGGHLPMVMVKPDAGMSLLDVEEGPPLGLIKSDFSEGSTAYEPGTIFALYTDGVTEAMSVKEEMFGQDRLLDIVARLKRRSPVEIVEAIHSAVLAFAGKAPQHDDITVVTIKT